MNPFQDVTAGSGAFAFPAPLREFEQRVTNAREACLALYLDEPTAQGAMILVTLEQAIAKLRRQREKRETK